MSALLVRDNQIVVKRGLGGQRGIVNDDCQEVCCPDCWYLAAACEDCQSSGADNVIVPCSLVTASTQYFRHAGHCWYVDTTMTKITDSAGLEPADLSEVYASCEECEEACDALGTGCGGTSGITRFSSVTVSFCHFQCRITNRCYYPINQACGHETPTLPTDCDDPTADCDLPALPTCDGGVIGRQSILEFSEGVKATDIVVPFALCHDPPTRNYITFATEATVMRTQGNVCDTVTADCVSSPFTWQETQGSEEWYEDVVPVTVRLEKVGGNFVYTLIVAGIPLSTITLAACTSSGSRTDSTTATQESTPNVTICGQLRRSCQTVHRYANLGGDIYNSWSIDPSLVFC